MQSASSVILVRPTGFGYDPETAASNGFQRMATDPMIRAQAAAEFDGLLQALDDCGISTTVLDPVAPEAPNAVFPNNWFSTHEDGTVVLYPMLTPSRRVERPASAEAMRALLEGEGLHPGPVIDLSPWERDGRILEGTGSLVLDRVQRRAFACLSPRTTEEAVSDWGEVMGYGTLTFRAAMDGTPEGQPVYHTNVLLSIGSGFALVCLEALIDPDERVTVERALAATGREVVQIDLAQMHAYAGNLLELPSRHHRPHAPVGTPHVFLSATAFAALRPHQRLALERHARLMPVEVPTIEAVGGGSVRCMLAENFLADR